MNSFYSDVLKLNKQLAKASSILISTATACFEALFLYWLLGPSGVSPSV